MKKIMKIILIILGLILVAVIVLAVLYRDTIGIMLGNRKVQPHTEVVHDIATSPVQPITKGEADWISWRNINGDNRSVVTGVKTDWSNGLKKIWEIDYLCDGEDSATWSAPVIFRVTGLLSVGVTVKMTWYTALIRKMADLYGNSHILLKPQMNMVPDSGLLRGLMMTVYIPMAGAVIFAALIF